MKKLTLCLGILLSTSTLAFRPFPDCSPCCDCCELSIPNLCGGFTFGITGVYWRPTTPHLDYALTYPSNTLNPFVDGEFHSVDLDYKWGYMLNFGYTFPCSGNDVLITLTHFAEQDSNRTHLPSEGLLLPTLTDDWAGGATAAITIGPVSITTITLVNLASTVLTPLPVVVIPAFPVTLTATQPTFATGHAEFKENVIDLDLGQYLNVCSNTQLRWFGGLRYFRLEHKLEANYVGTATGTASASGSTAIAVSVADGPIILTTINLSIDVSASGIFTEAVKQLSDFHGLGPRFGVVANYHIGCGFGLVGSLSGSLLIGQIDSSLNDNLRVDSTAFVNEIGAAVDETIIDDFTLDVNVGDIILQSTITEQSFKHRKVGRVVPNWDAKLGFDYTYEFCNCSRSRITLEAGYLVSHYWNAIDRLSEVEVDKPEFRTRHTIDASFDGPYIMIQVQL